MISTLTSACVDYFVEYAFCSKDKLLAAAKIPLRLHEDKIDFLGFEHGLFTMRFDSTTAAAHTARRPRAIPSLAFEIFDIAKERVGSIQGRMSRRFFGRFYHELEFNGGVYKAFEVHQPTEGLCISIFRGSEQVGYVHKSDEGYTMYTLRDTHFSAVALFLLYYDYNDWANQDRRIPISRCARKAHLSAAYDKSFLERCE